MRNVRVDTHGQFRCWKCGGAQLISKRTLRSKVAFGVGAMLTKKKLKCQLCGEYSDTGNAKPYRGPASKRLGKKYGTFTGMHGARDGVELVDDNPAEEMPDGPDDDDLVPSPQSPPNWYPDPSGRFQLRYFDGVRWTQHVSTNGDYPHGATRRRVWVWRRVRVAVRLGLTTRLVRCSAIPR